MIIKWIREFPGHGRQEKRIYSGDAYNAPRRGRRPSCGVRVRCRWAVFFSFLIFYFSAVICLSDAARPYNNNNNIIHRTGTFLLNLVRGPRCVMYTEVVVVVVKNSTYK